MVANPLRYVLCRGINIQHVVDILVIERIFHHTFDVREVGHRPDGRLLDFILPYVRSQENACYQRYEYATAQRPPGIRLPFHFRQILQTLYRRHSGAVPKDDGVT